MPNDTRTFLKLKRPTGKTEELGMEKSSNWRNLEYSIRRIIGSMMVGLFIEMEEKLIHVNGRARHMCIPKNVISFAQLLANLLSVLMAIRRCDEICRGISNFKQKLATIRRIWLKNTLKSMMTHRKRQNWLHEWTIESNWKIVRTIEWNSNEEMKLDECESETFKFRYQGCDGCHIGKHCLEKHRCGGCHVIKVYLEKYGYGGCHMKIDCLDEQRQSIELEPLPTNWNCSINW